MAAKGAPQGPVVLVGGTPPIALLGSPLHTYDLGAFMAVPITNAVLVLEGHLNNWMLFT